MTQDKQRVFIYDRREMGVLTLLGVMVAVFAFTLGVHLGKRVGTKTAAVGAAAPNAGAIGTKTDQTPDGKDLSDEARGIQQAADEAASQALHEEVERTGAKLDSPRQVDLPKGPKSANAGATTGTQAAEHTDAPKHEEHAAEAPKHEEPVAAKVEEHEEPEHEATAHAAHGGRFSLQIGSYPGREEAKARVQKLAGKGLRASIHEAEIHGKGKWFRVFVGEFASKNDAERAGQRYRAEHVIDSFIVAKVATQQ